MLCAHVLIHYCSSILKSHLVSTHSMATRLGRTDGRDKVGLNSKSKSHCSQMHSSFIYNICYNIWSTWRDFSKTCYTACNLTTHHYCDCRVDHALVIQSASGIWIYDDHVLYREILSESALVPWVAWLFNYNGPLGRNLNCISWNKIIKYMTLC